MDYAKEALIRHEQSKGKISVMPKINLDSAEDLSIAYTPGVAAPCKEIERDTNNAYRYTSKGNLVAVVTDGSAVLGLGNIGPEAAMPVMEGKAILFKMFGNVDAFPVCLDTQEIDKIIDTVKIIAPTFGGINLEDIAAPKCFEIEEKLQRELNIPVFHDDQHGTAIVVIAALINALKITGKKMDQIKVAISGPGAAGTAIAKMLITCGVKDIIMCDRTGIIVRGREKLTPHKEWLADNTNYQLKSGTMEDSVVGVDVYVGVSGPGLLTEKMVYSMAKEPIIFAMANPIPEIMPDLAIKAGAKIVGTGRSDFPNQINNVLAFPGIFRGALDVRAKKITEKMKLAAAYAIANLVKEEELSESYIIPKAMDKNVATAVAEAVGKAWLEETK